MPVDLEQPHALRGVLGGQRRVEVARVQPHERRALARLLALRFVERAVVPHHLAAGVPRVQRLLKLRVGVDAHAHDEAPGRPQQRIGLAHRLAAVAHGREALIALPGGLGHPAARERARRAYGVPADLPARTGHPRRAKPRHRGTCRTARPPRRVEVGVGVEVVPRHRRARTAGDKRFCHSRRVACREYAAKLLAARLCFRRRRCRKALAERVQGAVDDGDALGARSARVGEHPRREGQHADHCEATRVWRRCAAGREGSIEQATSARETTCVAQKVRNFEMTWHRLHPVYRKLATCTLAVRQARQTRCGFS